MQAGAEVLRQLIGESQTIVALREQIQGLVRRQAGGRRFPPILLHGETGTGKGLVAQLLHRASPRAAGPFVDVNCAAIPESLLEAEMFGFERGAFTEARQAKPGLFQAAHGGTIFLDEIGLLPEGLQGKLLKVTEDRTVRRLGSVLAQHIDVQIIAATSRDLADAVQTRAFREDLYHRLAVLTLHLPALRERGADVVALAEHFLVRACADYGLPAKRLAPDAGQALLAYPWPGNVRELSNLMERVAILGDSLVVTAADLALPHDARPARASSPAASPLEDPGRERVLATLAETQGNITKAAARLGIARNTLLARMAKYELRTAPAKRTTPPAASEPDAAAAANGSEPAVSASPGAAVPGSTERAVSGSPGLRWGKRWLGFLRVDLVDEGGMPLTLGSSRSLEVVTEKIRSFGGRLEELTPASAVGVFGLDPAEDAPRRAAHAALAIGKAAERARAHERSAPALRIAVTVAEALAAFTDREVIIDANARREALDTLGRLVAESSTESLRVARSAARFFDRRFDVVPVSPLACELVGGERSGLVRTRFVGRSLEVGVIRRAWDRAAAGHGQVVGITGDPGVGKSRLVREAVPANELSGGRVLQTQAVPYTGTTPYAAVSGLLRSYFGIDDRDDAAGICAKVARALEALGADVSARLRPPVLALLDQPVDDDEWNAADAPARRQWTLEACTGLLLRESQARPLALVFEDLHWIDPASQAVLDRLVEMLPTTRILVLAVYRPEYRHAWTAKTYYAQLPVDPLPADAAGELVTALIGPHPDLEPLRRLLVQRTEGNPFFLEETVRTLVETGALVETPGGYRLVRPIDTVSVPSTVQAVLSARIDRLPDAQRDLLQAAAVVGRDVPVALLQAVTRRPAALTALLADLRDAEFLYERATLPEVEYTFKHALTHEVAYASLPAERRRALHADVMAAIERLHRDRLPEHVERLADHAVQGELWAKAIVYLRRAGAKAARHSAYADAASRFEQALAVLDRLPPTADRLAEAIDVRFDLRSVLLPLGQLDRILERLREAEAIATRLGDQRRLGWVASYVTIHYILSADSVRSIASGEVARKSAEGAADTALTVVANAYLGNACYDSGDYQRASQRLRASLEALPANAVHERFGQASLPSVYARNMLALSAAELGEFDLAERQSTEAVRIAEDADHPFSLGFALLGRGSVQVLRGDWAAAIETLERGLDLARTRAIPLWIPMTSAALGCAYAHARRLTEAQPLLEHAATRAAAMQVYWRHSLSLIHLAEGYLLAGREPDARGAAAEALRLTQERGETGYHAWALRLLALIASNADPPAFEDARRSYRSALALAAERAMRPLTAHCHLGLATLARRERELHQAHEHLSIAAPMYGEMAMTFWSERAEEELQRLGEIRSSGQDAG
jgi:transcriptional regulator with AAA-type ATPase domain/tetratricopeptide (TPR) repeat protein